MEYHHDQLQKLLLNTPATFAH